MPDDFPTSYEVVAVEARNRQWAAVPNQEFGESWNAVPLRFRAVCHHAEQVESSLARFGPGPEPDERWRQELHIFGFFANGLAVLESALYACFALGYLSTPEQFPFETPQDRRNVNPASVASAYRRAFPKIPLTAAMQATISDQHYSDWRDTRNVLSHRQAPGRHHVMSSRDKTVSGTLALTPTFATDRRKQLSVLLTQIVDEVPPFIRSHL